MLKIFIDTGAFCAFSDRSDYYHFLAVKQFTDLLQKRTPIVTSNFIIDETYTWIRYRLGPKPSMEFLKSMHDSRGKGLLEIITVEHSLEDRAMRLLQKFHDQNLSYTDATNIAIIQEQHIRTVFTFDKHFLLIKANIIPGVAK